MSEERNRAGEHATFFDAHQRATIEAAVARIIPTDDRPGAREAGVAEFIDRYLSGIGYIYAKPDGSGFETLEGKQAEAWQRRVDILRATYVAGIQALDRLSESRFGAAFAALDEDQQDDVLRGMERPQQAQQIQREQSTAAWEPPPPDAPAMQQTSTETELDFFPLLALHTRQGFYSDPIYGGNQNHVGWQLIGFEGPESLAETHAGRYTTLPFFAEEQIDWAKESHHDRES